MFQNQFTNAQSVGKLAESFHSVIPLVVCHSLAPPPPQLKGNYDFEILFDARAALVRHNFFRLT